MATAKEKLQRHEHLAELKRPEEKVWRDIGFLMRPDENDFDDPAQRKDRDDEELLDSSLLYAAEDLVGGLISQGANIASRWLEIKVGDDDFMKWGPVRDAVAAFTRRLYASLGPGVSKFYVNVPQWFADATAFGPGYFMQEELVGQQRILDQAVPLSQAFKNIGPDGEMNEFHRVLPYYGQQILARWKDTLPDPNKIRAGDKYKIIHAVYPNDGWRPGALGPRGFQYSSCFFCEEIKDWIVEGGFHELPYHEIEWRRRAGRLYARGVGHVVRADGFMLQEMERTTIVGAQYDAEPMVLTRNDTDITAADFYPNAHLDGGMGDQGKPNVGYLERKGNKQLAEAKSEQRRNAMKQAFRFSIGSIQNRPQMTAFEFAGWQKQELQLMAPNLTQIHEGLASFVKRRFQILARAGQFADIPVPPEMRGKSLEIEFVSPLAKAQKLEIAQSRMTFLGYIDQQIANTQDPSIGDLVDRHKSLRKIADAMLADADDIRSPEEVEKLAAARAEQAQKAKALEQAGQVAEIAATAAHASAANASAAQKAAQ